MNINIESIIIEDITKTGAFIFLYFILLLFSKWLKELFSPYNIDEQLTQEDNVAVSLIMCGYYLAVTFIFIGSFYGPSYGLQTDLVLVGQYSLIGIIVLNLSRFVNDKIILRKFCNIHHIVNEHNVAVGSVQFGSYLATGLIAAGAVMGEGGGVGTFIIFFLLGQLSLFLFAIIYEFFSAYNIHEELEKNNTSAGVGFGGTLIALGIIITNGVSGDFMNWQDNLTLVALMNISAFIFLPIIRVVMDKLVIPGDQLSREIKEDQNLGAGLLEATVAISFALILNITI